jgi:integrase/recombinase XerC/integrase/recombinase XerD
MDKESMGMGNNIQKTMTTDKPILQLMDEFLANQDISEISRKKYRDNLHVFIGWLTRNADMNNLQKATIIAYKQWLIDSGRTPSTIDNYLAPVRQFFKYLAECDIHKNIAVDVRSPKKSQSFSKDYLRSHQVRQLLNIVNRANTYGLRDYAIINLMVRTGMRCIEVSRANVEDLRQEEGRWILYIQGKGRYAKDRALGVTEKIVNPIAEYITAHELKQSSPLFLNHSYVSRDTRITTITISKTVKRYLRSIGIDNSKISAHSLRHTAAITALKSGADILAVKSMLGHNKIETTMIYQRAIEEERGRDGTAIRMMDDAY